MWPGSRAGRGLEWPGGARSGRAGSGQRWAFVFARHVLARRSGRICPLVAGMQVCGMVSLPMFSVRLRIAFSGCHVGGAR